MSTPSSSISGSNSSSSSNGSPKYSAGSPSGAAYLDYYAYNKYLRENTDKIIGRPLTPHALRHTHASLLMEAGVPIDVISRRLGHENSKVTKEIYLHVTKKLKQKDDELIGKVSLL